MRPESAHQFRRSCGLDSVSRKNRGIPDVGKREKLKTEITKYKATIRPFDLAVEGVPTRLYQRESPRERATFRIAGRLARMKSPVRSSSGSGGRCQKRGGGGVLTLSPGESLRLVGCLVGDGVLIGKVESGKRKVEIGRGLFGGSWSSKWRLVLRLLFRSG